MSHHPKSLKTMKKTQEEVSFFVFFCGFRAYAPVHSSGNRISRMAMRFRKEKRVNVTVKALRRSEQRRKSNVAENRKMMLVHENIGEARRFLL